MGLAWEAVEDRCCHAVRIWCGWNTGLDLWVWLVEVMGSYLLGRSLVEGGLCGLVNCWLGCGNIYA